MTLEELFGSDADTLEKLTDQELLEYFKPYLSVTRPELAVKPNNTRERSNSQYAPAPKFSEQQRKGLELLASNGIDISFASQRRKKK